MATQEFSVRVSPKTAANKALALLKRARLNGFKLKDARVEEKGDRFAVSARWEEGGFFGGSAALEVITQKAYDGSTQVTTTHSAKCAKVAERLRRSL